MLCLENLKVDLSPQDPPLKILQNDSLLDLNRKITYFQSSDK